MIILFVVEFVMIEIGKNYKHKQSWATQPYLQRGLWIWCSFSLVSWLYSQVGWKIFLWNWRYFCTFWVLSRHFYQLFGHGNNFPYWETLLIFCNKIFYCICQELHSEKSGQKSHLKTAQNWVGAINTKLPKFFVHQVVSFKPSPSPRVEEVKPFVPITKVFTCQDWLLGPKKSKLWGAFYIIFTCLEDYL